MPEGDTVWNTARVLERALVGQALSASDFRVPALAPYDRSCLSRDGDHRAVRRFLVANADARHSMRMRWINGT